MKALPEKVIGLILKGYPRLSETFIMNEILLLEERGFNVHIFAMRNPGEAAVHDSVRRVRAPVTYIPDYFWRYFFAFMHANFRLWRRRPRVYWQALRFAAGHSLRQRNSSTLKRFAQAAYLVERGLPNTGVMHFHAHFSHDPTTVAFFASRLTGLPYSFSAHAKDIYLQEVDFLRRKIATAQFVATCTEHNKRYLQEIAGVEAEIIRSYHGLDLNFFPRSGNREFNPVPRILSVGRLVPKKGFSVLLKALSTLRQRGYDFRCTIIGSGPMEKELRKQIAKLDLNGFVELHSPVSQNQLLDYYRSADLFALACEVQKDGDRDGIPNVIVEALAMGVPVISTRISGIPECVDHGANGLLVPQQNPTALADAMAAILNDSALAQQFSRAGRKKVEEYFDARQNIEPICAALQQAIDNEPQPVSRPFKIEQTPSPELTHV